MNQFISVSGATVADKGDGADSTATEQSAEAKFGPMGTWDFPQTLGALKDVDNIEYVLFPGYYTSAMEKGEDPAKETNIYYSAKIVEAGDTNTKVKAVVDVDEIPNSPLYRQEGRHRADVVAERFGYAAGHRHRRLHPCRA